MRDSLFSRFSVGPTFGLRAVRWPNDHLPLDGGADAKLVRVGTETVGSDPPIDLAKSGPPEFSGEVLVHLHRLAYKSRYGVIIVEPGGARVQPRWWPRFASAWDVARDSVVRPSNDPICQLYYSFPLRAPGFMAVNYLVCGLGTSYGLLRQAIRCVDYLAEIRGCQAIVCQAYSDRLTTRLMNRWGYVQHASAVGDRNYIRRIASTLAR